MSAVEAAAPVKRGAPSKGLPVVEIFGPTIQGEGPDAGRPVYFIRLGGCDYRCSWCDSMYAVEPAEVRKARRMGVDAIVEELERLPLGAQRVVISGGNPALHDLTALVAALQVGVGLRVAVETQGSVWRAWLRNVDTLVVSPKPPSSGMVTDKHKAQTYAFMTHVETWSSLSLKVVVFDVRDYLWARRLHRDYPDVPFYVSAGTPVDPNMPGEDTINEVLNRFAWLAETVAKDILMADAVVLPQLHVLAWGTVRGV